MTASSAIQPCTGLVVVDFGQGMAGGMPGMLLADNGASVVKIEPPQGDWSRGTPGFHMWNRGKSSVVLDLQDASDRARALALVARADVLIESFRPGVTQRLGIDWGTVRRENPQLVYCSITGFPATSPHAQLAGYEGLVAARTGRMIGLEHVSGKVDSQDRDSPIFTAVPIASFGAAQLAVQGILAALLARSTTGSGEHISTSLEQGVAAFLMRQELMMGDDVAPSVPETLPRGIDLCFLTAECSDGRYLQMCARQDKHFRLWLEAIGLGAKLDEPRYRNAPLHIATVEDINELELAIRAYMLEKSSDHWMHVFTAEYDVGADPFFTFDEFLAHPDMVENGRIVTIDDPETGPCRQIGPLALFSDTPSQIGTPAPSLGQWAHAEELVPDTPRMAVPASGARMTYPLEGVTILEIAYFVAGPLAGALLAEMGARVIKVEPLEGDPYRRSGLQATKFLHGKESIGLDLKNPRSATILHDLVRRCDVVVHSFRPGVPERLGIGYSQLSEINPQLIYVFAASYGSKGPQAQRTAYHSTPNALNGSGILQAGRGNPPADDSYPDPGSALGVATAILLGLHARQRTGEGQFIETTMLAASSYVVSPYLTRYEGMPPDLIPDQGQHGLHALYRLYRCAQGWIFLSCVQDREWPRLLEGLGRQDWAHDPRFGDAAARLAHDDELTLEIAQILSTDTAGEWQSRLDGSGAPATVVTEVVQEKWFESEGRLLPERHPMFGDYWRPPAKVDFESLGTRFAPAAGVSEHARAILFELGYSEEDYRELVESGAVGSYREKALDLSS
ncbi:MAG: CaiB/BaiF CoA transferase family protein [Acidimicrobiales bacterium]